MTERGLAERPPLQGRRLGGPEGLYRTCTGDEGCRKRKRRGCLGGRGAANAPLPRVASKHLKVSAGSSVGAGRQLRNAREERAEQWTTSALKIPFWESVHGEPRGNGHRVGPPPADGRGPPSAGDKGAYARVARGVGRKERRRGCRSAPQSKVGGGAHIPWCATRVQEMQRASGAGEGVPVVAGAAMRQGALRPGGDDEFPGRPVAAFCKTTARTCRPVLGQVRARSVAEGSSWQGRAGSGWRHGESGEVAGAAGWPLGDAGG